MCSLFIELFFSQILSDFKVQFPKVNADGFTANWPKYAASINEVLTSYRVDICTEWSEDIEQMLALFKLLPAKTGKNSKSSALPFCKVIEKFIVHSEVY